MAGRATWLMGRAGQEISKIMAVAMTVARGCGPPELLQKLCASAPNTVLIFQLDNICAL